MELSALGARLKVTNARAIDKAKEYQRLATMRAGGAGAIAVTPEARSVACIELGCKFHGLTVDPALCLKYSLCKNAAAYSKMLTHLSQMLGVTSIVTTRELAIKHGCIQAHDFAKSVLARYKEAIRASAPNAQAAEGATAVLDTRNVYPVVAFYIACKYMKLVGIDRKRLCTEASVGDREFQTVAESFYTHMPEFRPPERKPAKPRKRKQLEAPNGTSDGNDEAKAAAAKDDDDAADEFDEEKEIDDVADAADANDAQTSSSKPLGYAKWKAKVTNEAQAENRQALEPLAKKHKSTPNDVASSSCASPDEATSVSATAASLKQSKLNFGAPSAKTKQLIVEPDDDGEAEL